MVEAPDVYTVEEVAAMLRIGRTAAYEAVRRGEIPAVRIGRTLRVPRQAVQNLLSLNRDPLGEVSDTAVSHP